MKSLYFALALVLTTPIVSGCQQLTSVTSSQNITEAEKALTVAHLAYNSLGTIILDATKTGVLKGSTAAQVKVYYDKAGDALLVADKADKAANATDLANAIASAQDAIASASTLIGSK